MAVTWVAGTNFSQTTGTSIAVNAPAGLADGDTLLAGVAARSTIIPPSGWTLVAQTSYFTDGTSTQRLAVYKKDATVSGDASASFTWSQSSSDVIAVAYAAARGADSSITSATYSGVSSFIIGMEPAAATASADGQLMIIFGSTTEGEPGTGNPEEPPDFTLFTQSTASDYRLAGIYATRDTGDGEPDFFMLDADYDNEFSVSYGLGAITLLLGEGSPSVDALISAEGPLGAPELLGRVHAAAFISVEGPLLYAVSPAVLGWHDFSGAINGAGVARYYMDLITPGGDVRVPISSWQATLQTDSAQYVQCVVPACAEWVDDITDATAFRLSRLLTLSSGATLEYQIAQAPLDTVQFAQGSTNHSATLSGYIDAAPVLTWPDGTERTLTGVQSIYTYSSGLRVRCAIDWLLQPGQSAQVGETVFTASYINYIVSGNEAYMDVGERLEA